MRSSSISAISIPSSLCFPHVRHLWMPWKIGVLLLPSNELLHLRSSQKLLEHAVAVSKLVLSPKRMDLVMALATNHDVVAWVIFGFLVFVVALHLRDKMVKRQLSFTAAKRTDRMLLFSHFTKTQELNSSETQALATSLGFSERLENASTRFVLSQNESDAMTSIFPSGVHSLLLSSKSSSTTSCKSTPSINDIAASWTSFGLRVTAEMTHF